ncbi:MAG TPA: hypothetical protein VGE07_03325, partial [Herpetosiphonaceae bacterium]
APADDPAHPLLHGGEGGVLIHVGPLEGALGPDELRRAAEAALASGGRELRCLAWEFAPDLAGRAADLEAELGLVITLVWIPRELLEPNRPAAAFFEAGLVECELIERDGAFDVRLAHFAPALAATDRRPALRERAAAAPLDFLDCWAIDFAWAEGAPFAYHWQACRERPGGPLSLRSDIGWRPEDGGPFRIGVKAIDVFGFESLAVLEAPR